MPKWMKKPLVHKLVDKTLTTVKELPEKLAKKDEEPVAMLQSSGPFEGVKKVTKLSAAAMQDLAPAVGKVKASVAGFKENKAEVQGKLGQEFREVLGEGALTGRVAGVENAVDDATSVHVDHLEDELVQHLTELLVSNFFMGRVSGSLHEIQGLSEYLPVDMKEKLQPLFDTSAKLEKALA